MSRLLTILAIVFFPFISHAEECPDVLDLGTVISAAPLNGAASTLTATVGPLEDLSSTSFRKCQVASYRTIVYDVYFNYTAQAGSISTTITGGQTTATATRKLTSCTPSGGNCTLNLGGVATTASLSVDTGWLLPVSTNHARVIKAVFAHGGSPGATDTLTVKIWLVR